MITITDPIICDFYERNPHISFEKMNLLLIDVLNATMSNNNNNNNNNNSFGNNNSNLCVLDKGEHIKISDTIRKVVSEKLDIMSNNNNETQLKEMMNHFEMKSTLMLQNMQQPLYSFISNSEDRLQKGIETIKSESRNDDKYGSLLKDITTIIENRHNHSSGNIRLAFNTMYTSADVRSVEVLGVDEGITMKRFRKPDILIQLKYSEENIQTEEITTLYKNVSDFNSCGIIISQNSGFVGKQDFHVDIHNNQVIVFIHNYKNDDLKLQMAVNIIDNLMTHINHLKLPMETNIHIPKDILDKVNNEYQLFLSQKNAVVDVLKDTQKKVIAQMDEIKFPFLEKYLSTKFVAPVCNSGLKCVVCKNYSANNLKALAAHKRGCLRKHPHYNINKGGDKENIINE